MYHLRLHIEEVQDGVFLGTSRDLPGFVVQGSSPEEVLRLAPDVASDFIAVLLETGQPVPAPVTLRDTPTELAVYVPA